MALRRRLARLQDDMNKQSANLEAAQSGRDVLQSRVCELTAETERLVSVQECLQGRVTSAEAACENVQVSGHPGFQVCLAWFGYRTESKSPCAGSAPTADGGDGRCQDSVQRSAAAACNSDGAARRGSHEQRRLAGDLVLARRWASLVENVMLVLKQRPAHACRRSSMRCSDSCKTWNHSWHQSARMRRSLRPKSQSGRQLPPTGSRNMSQSAQCGVRSVWHAHCVQYYCAWSTKMQRALLG